MRRDETKTKTKPKTKVKRLMAAMPIERTAYTIEESAASIGVSRATIYRLIKEGRGPKITHLGGRRIITIDHHREFVRSLSEAAQ
jgi:excisionase family DNA binding protein